MIFLSSGHNAQSKTIKQDPGAVANGYKEGDLTIEFKNLVAKELRALGAKFITDDEEESLRDYVTRIKTGSGSVVVEYHFDAASPQASGTVVLVEVDADRLDRAFAKELVESTATTLGIPSRGIRSEADTRHKRLALMTENGLVALVELGFLTNMGDVAAYQAHKRELAKKHAAILVKYEQLIP